MNCPTTAAESPPGDARKKEAAPRVIEERQSSGERKTSHTSGRPKQARNQPLSLSEAQAIAESIVGPVPWQGAQGFIPCPGAARHTTATNTTDCKVVCMPVPLPDGELKPGCFCFHDSCATEVEAASFAIRSALGKRSPSNAARVSSPFIMPTRPKPAEFDPVKLEKIAAKLDGVDAEFFAVRSKKRVDNRTPASFLHELYQPGERVVVFDVFNSQGQALWTHKLPPFDAGELDRFRTGKQQGVWFQANPVSGEYADTGKLNLDGSPHLSRRSFLTVTAFRFLVLESDAAKPAHWLAALAQMPLPIAAIYSSGGKSIHSLVRVDAGSKAEWDEKVNRFKSVFITLGADRKAISAVRLTRLPCCLRLGSQGKDGTYQPFVEPRMQALLYLNGSPDGTPICEQGALR